MWHLDEIIRRNNPEREPERLSDFIAAVAGPEPVEPVLEWPFDFDGNPESDDTESADPLNYGPGAELWRRETITQYVVIDNEGHVIESFDTYEEARDVAADDEQIVPLTGEGFVKAYL